MLSIVAKTVINLPIGTEIDRSKVIIHELEPRDWWHSSAEMQKWGPPRWVGVLPFDF